MAWLLLDVALVLLVLVVVAVTGLALYRAVRALLRRVGDAGDALARAGEGASAISPADATRRVP